MSPVNHFIGVSPSSPDVREQISTSQTRPKSHMHFGTLLRILLRLDLYLSIFIILLDLFYQGEYGSIIIP